MKIIGNGLLSSIFCENDNYNCLIFASGVSNSSETSSENFNRERKLIINTIEEYSELTFVYFSSVFIERNNPYYFHKKEMEKIIKDNCKNYLIIRLPQIVGKTGNKNNIFNLFKNKINNNDQLTIYGNFSRSLIDVEDVKTVVLHCLDNKIYGEINFVEVESVNILDLAKRISKILNKKPNYLILNNKEESISFRNTFVIDELIKNETIKSHNYINNILKKYLNHD